MLIKLIIIGSLLPYFTSFPAKSHHSYSQKKELVKPVEKIHWPRGPKMFEQNS